MIACLDLEGVLIPEIWVGVAEKTQIDELRLTTREIPDYDVLMKKRLDLLAKNSLTLSQIHSVISTLKPLEGAVDFVNWLRSELFQVIILSDTFYEFAQPLMKQLGYPCLFCHRLEINEKDQVVNYHLRLSDQKTKAVQSLQALNFKVVATGDSYNDVGMLTQANFGVFFNPPEKIIQEFPKIPVARDYEELKKQFLVAKQQILSGTYS